MSVLSDPWEGLSPPYGTIVADPPWGYEKRTAPWRSTTEPGYSLMATDQIAALPVADLAAPDAHLYLWAVPPMMAEAYKVVDAWGFHADTILTWCKPGPGLGGGWRGNTEHLIVARRGFSWINPNCAECGGRPRGKGRRCSCEVPSYRYKGEPCGVPVAPFLTTAEGTWYEAPRREHSQKPDLFGDLIEAMSPGPRVELFARAQRLGWDSWGWGYEGSAA